MFILELILTIFYFLVIILILAVILALAIPFGLLFLIYWILFRSWRSTSKSKKTTVSKSNLDPKDIGSIVNLSKKHTNTKTESKVLKKDIKKYIENAIESSNVKDKNEEH